MKDTAWLPGAQSCWSQIISKEPAADKVVCEAVKRGVRIWGGWLSSKGQGSEGAFLCKACIYPRAREVPGRLKQSPHCRSFWQ
jgi:hypothetical protein